MKIGIDARTLGVKGGSKTYAKNLLINFPNDNKFVLFGVSHFENFKCVPENSNQQNPFLRVFYDIFKLPKLIKKYKIDIFHGLKGVAPKTDSIKTIITVHDINVFKYPQFANFKDLIYWKYFSPKKIMEADKIISVSNATKNDLIEKLNIPPDKIRVIHESYDSDLYRIRNDRQEIYKKLFEKTGIDFTNKKIILNVNTISPRKNITGIIRAFNLMSRGQDNVFLVIAGRNGWKTGEVYNEFKKSPVKDKIYFTGFISDEMVVDFYNISEVFIYPSFYEGFGLPILEAQACGCPVITSNNSSMPEIAGNGAILIDPCNDSEMAEALGIVIFNKNVRQELISNGLKNCLNFSWKKCAKETLSVYDEMYDKQ